MIKIEHLVKNYGTLCALDDVSLEIERGEIIGLLGPNGAGKSPMMNVLTGYLSATSGRAEIDGSDIADDPMGAKKRIGYLPEQPPVYPDMTVFEYLRFVCELKGVTKDKEKHINEVCATVKIADVGNRLIKNLSKGYRQRVGIAQAIVGDPELIIFDEPTVGLDPKQIIEVRNLIRTLGKSHTIILSTHILQEVQAVCDRIVIINKGKIVADEKAENITRAVSNARKVTAKICGPSKDVLAVINGLSGVATVELLPQKDGDASVYLIEADAGVDIRKNLFYEMANKKFPIVGLENSGMNLEDIFLAVVDMKEADEAKKKKGRATHRSAEAELAQMLRDKAKNNGSAE